MTTVDTNPTTDADPTTREGKELEYVPEPEEQQLQVVPHGAVALEKEPEPTALIEKAQIVARKLHEIVEASGLSYNLGGSKPHLGYEAWELLGRFNNATVDIVLTRRLTNEGGEFLGYEAQAKVLRNGLRIGGADAMCTNQEPNWARKPEFQLRSMAQTRAASKALRMVFSWIAVLAGYDPTPREELTGDEFVKPTDVIPTRSEPVAGGSIETVRSTSSNPCAVCGMEMQQVPAGISKVGKPYNAFYACRDRAHKQPYKKATKSATGVLNATSTPPSNPRRAFTPPQ